MVALCLLTGICGCNRQPQKVNNPQNGSKILNTYGNEKLPTDGVPDGCEPHVGDFCLYAPWGNLSLFYQDFRYSESLVILGHVDSEMDIISGRNENFSAVLEAVEAN